MMQGELQPGTKCGPYQITRLIAAGGQGEVYEAVHDFTDQRVALKCLQLRHAGKKDLRERMRMEAVLLCKLRHPNIVTVYNAGITESGVVFIAMDLLEGRTLRQILDGPPLPLSIALGYAQRIAAGVAAAHELGVVHRDLKPENVFVTTQDELKVLDLGTAKFYGYGPRITDEKKTPGTPAYMSPEHLAGEDVDGRSDVYALGLIVYEMLAGRHPFSRGKHELPSDRELVGMQFVAEPTPLPSLLPGFPDLIWRVVATAVAKKREQRFPTMGDLARALAEAAAGVPNAGPPAAVPARSLPGSAVSPLAPTVPAQDDQSGAGWDWAASTGGAGGTTNPNPTGDVGLAFERDVRAIPEPAPGAPVGPPESEPRLPTLLVTGAEPPDAGWRMQSTRTDPRGLSAAPKSPPVRPASAPRVSAGSDDASTIVHRKGRADRRRITIVALSAALGMATAALLLLGPWSPRRRANAAAMLAASESPAPETRVIPVAEAARRVVASPAAEASRSEPLEIEAGAAKDIASPGEPTSVVSGRSLSAPFGNQKLGKKYVLPVFGGQSAAGASPPSTSDKKEESR